MLCQALEQDLLKGPLLTKYLQPTLLLKPKFIRGFLHQYHEVWHGQVGHGDDESPLVWAHIDRQEPLWDLLQMWIGPSPIRELTREKWLIEAVDFMG